MCFFDIFPFQMILESEMGKIKSHDGNVGSDFNKQQQQQQQQRSFHFNSIPPQSSSSNRLAGHGVWQSTHLLALFKSLKTKLEILGWRSRLPWFKDDLTTIQQNHFKPGVSNLHRFWTVSCSCLTHTVFWTKFDFLLMSECTCVLMQLFEEPITLFITWNLSSIFEAFLWGWYNLALMEIMSSNWWYAEWAKADSS